MAELFPSMQADLEQVEAMKVPTGDTANEKSIEQGDKPLEFVEDATDITVDLRRDEDGKFIDGEGDLVEDITNDSGDDSANKNKVSEDEFRSESELGKERENKALGESIRSDIEAPLTTDTTDVHQETDVSILFATSEIELEGTTALASMSTLEEGMDLNGKTILQVSLGAAGTPGKTELFQMIHLVVQTQPLRHVSTT